MNKMIEIKDGRWSSKTFRTIFKSILMIMPVPIILIVLAEVFSLVRMEKLVDDFEDQMRRRVMVQVEQDFNQAYVVANKLRSDEVLLSYVKQSDRDYYDEWEIYEELRTVMSGYNNIEEIYLYFPEYEYVISTANGGKESKYFHAANYSDTYDEWLEALENGIMGTYQTVKDVDGKIKNIITTSLDNAESQNRVIAVIQLDTEYLENLFSTLITWGAKGEVFLLSENNMLSTSFEKDSSEFILQLLECSENEKENIVIEEKEYKLDFLYSQKSGLHLICATLKNASYTATAFTKVGCVIIAILGAVILVILSFVVAKKNYLPIYDLLSVVNDADLEQNGIMEELGDLEWYLQKSIRTRQEMNEKIRQYEEDMKELHLGQLLFQGNMSDKWEMTVDHPFKGKYFAVLLCVFEEIEQESEVLDSKIQETDRKEILIGYLEECFAELDFFEVLEGIDGFFCIFNGSSESKEDFENLLKKEQNHMKNILASDESIFCNCYLSEIKENLKDIHKGYEEVRKKFINKEIQDKTEKNEKCSIDCIIDMIHQELSDENLSVNRIAEQIGLNPSYLSRYFKNQIGVGILEYIHQCRLQKAKDIIKNNSDIKNYDVAVQCGFCNITTFIRVFKKYEGMTPGQYREKIGIHE